MQSNIIIYGPNPGQTIANVTFDTTSYRKWEVMGEHAVTINFSLPQPDNGIDTGYLDIPIGSYIEFQNRRYTLYNPSDFIKNGNRDYKYTLKLHSNQELLNERIFRNETDDNPIVNRTGRPEEFLEAVVRNMNHFETGNWDANEWEIGEYISTEIPQNIQFDGITCTEALKLIAEAFNTEWEVAGDTNKVISLRKVEYFKDTPLKMMYGGGQARTADSGGFIPGLGRSKYDENRPIHRLYVKGGDRNIDFSEYGSQTLQMPKNTTISFDGTHFDDEVGFDSSIARSYLTDANGKSIIRTDIPQISRREGFVESTEAYPKFVGEITNIVWIYNNVEYSTYEQAVQVAGDKNKGSIFCDIFDTTIPEGLDYTNMRIGGEQAILVPQTGLFAGREISIQQSEEAITGYIHSERRFKLLTDSDFGNFYIPDGRLKIGDKYAIFGIKLPQVYINNGERDLLKDAVRYKYENEEQRFTFTGKMDSLWSKRNWSDVSSKIVAGGCVNFSDPQFHPQGTLIRISAIQEPLHEPEAPEITLTNIVIGGGLRTELSKIPQQEVIIGGIHREARSAETRRWKDALETQSIINDTFASMGTAISGSTMQTMQNIIGHSAGQFQFIRSLGSDITVTPNITYSAQENTIHVSGENVGSAAYIRHQNLNSVGEPFAMDGKSATGTAGTTVRSPLEYMGWQLQPATLSLPDKEKPYILYAKVYKHHFSDAEFLVEEPGRTVFTDGDYLYLVIGIFNSEVEGARNFSPLYGFTEILPGQITTGILRSENGTYFDLNKGEIGGLINFTNGLISGDIKIYNNINEVTAFINGDNSNVANAAFGAGGDSKENAKTVIQHNGKLKTIDAEISGLFNTAQSGQRVEINPQTRMITLYNNNNNPVGSWGYYQSGSRLELSEQTTAERTMTTTITPNFQNFLGISDDISEFSQLQLYSSGISMSVGDNVGASMFEVRGAPSGLGVRFRGLPTSNPRVAGGVWNDNGTLKISNG